MGKLSSALAWAARGFQIFPLGANSKLPGPELNWTTSATTDPAAIRAWWLDPVTGFEQDYNIGMLTSRWIVPDIDVKAGKQGLETFAALGLDLDTLTIRTPSGGYHQVYQGLSTPVGQHSLGPGVDLRSHNGYVVAPGSTIDGVAYEVVIDEPPAPFPAHLLGRLRPPSARRSATVAPAADLDRPENLATALHWLQRDAPLAVQGQNGDATTYRVACRLRDFGLSQETALTALMTDWNEACSPPWPLAELERKIANAWAYATSEAGAAAPGSAFEDVQIVMPPAPKLNGHHYSHDKLYRFGNLIDIDAIQKRPFILGNLLLEGTVTMLVAGPGGGKTMLKLMIAAHLALGLDFMGHKCFRPGKVILYDAEDEVEELSRRLIAICMALGLDIEKVRKNIVLLSSEEIPFQLTKNGPLPLINEEHIRPLIEAARDPEVVAVMLGPLIELHSVNENDPVLMRYVMGVLRLVARDAKVAVLTEHHTAKPPLSSSESWAGSPYAGRGSSAVPGSARRTATLFAASPTDCIEIGAPLSDRAQYVRFDDGKVSRGKQGAPPSWMKWESVRLPNGDDVGVLKPFDTSTSVEHLAQIYGRIFLSEMRGAGTASLDASRALELMARESSSKQESRSALGSRLERLFEKPVSLDGASIRLVRENKTTRIVVS